MGRLGGGKLVGALGGIPILDRSIALIKLVQEIEDMIKHVAPYQITTAEILNSAISTAKLASGCVTYDKIATGAVITAKIADSAVITSKVATSTIKGTHLFRVSGEYPPFPWTSGDIPEYDSVYDGFKVQHPADLPFLLKSGGTMTGLLTLSGAPTADLHAATKLYVDTGLALKLALTGGTLTGDLVFNACNINLGNNDIAGLKTLGGYGSNPITIASGFELKFPDDSYIMFGTDNDIDITFDNNNTRLQINGDVLIAEPYKLLETVLSKCNVATDTKSTPIEGDLRWDSTNHKLQVYSGTAWETVSSS